VLFRANDRGQPKAQVAARSVRDLNPDVRVSALVGDVLRDVGLGRFRDSDVVIGCLDNREARLWVNRACWKVTTPWIDGGIQEISGVVKVFIPPESACYECSMTENDYRLINLRYSCPLLRQEDLQAGRIPTSPTISAVIAGWQAQEALKIIHHLPVEGGQAMVYNGVANRFYCTRFQRREDCLSHETYPPPVELDLRADTHPASDLFRAVRREAGFEASRLNLDRDLVLSLACVHCGTDQRVMQPRTAVGLSRSVCAQCGQFQRAEMVHSVEPESALARETLRALGVPPYDIVLVEGPQGTLACLLAGDRDGLAAGPDAGTESEP
jgi:adenylyltransferase/sulfurtransferase